jgi:hypothetical protein
MRRFAARNFSLAGLSCKPFIGRVCNISERPAPQYLTREPNSARRQQFPGFGYIPQAFSDASPEMGLEMRVGSI